MKDRRLKADRCTFRRCKGHPEVVYLGNPLCWRHWLQVAREDGDQTTNLPMIRQHGRKADVVKA